MVHGVRLKNLQLEIQPQKIDAVLISKVANIIYLTNYSSFSTEEREAFLLITPQQQLIFTDGRYCEAVKKLLPGFRLVEIGGGEKFKDLLKEVIGELKIKKLGIEEGDLKVSEFKQIKKVIRLLKDFKFHQQRSLKTEAEVSLIEKACGIGDRAFEFIISKIRIGISEKELGYLLEHFIRELGFEPSFKTIVAFGANSAIPHHQTGGARLKKGDFVLLDFGIRYKNYCSDMTRTLVFGKAAKKQKRMHQVVKAAQQKAFEYLKNVIPAKAGIQKKTAGSRIKSGMTEGVKAANLDKIARDHILKSGFPSIPHSLGHGIGIEVHEHPYLSPNSKEVLKEGMVFSIEPGIYIPGYGGVRIEDLYVLESNGIRQLTGSPKELIEI